MNRIEEILKTNHKTNKKTIITYMTAGLPDIEGTKEIIKAQAESGIDIIELGVPFSDPAAGTPIIQEASNKSIQKGTNLKKIFTAVQEVRTETKIPIVLMLYYNTILCYGVDEFVNKCIEVSVDGLIIPDLPFEEQGELASYLANHNTPIIIQYISETSKGRITKILKDARGFVYCVSSLDSQANTINYLSQVKKESKLPLMIDYSIKQSLDYESIKGLIDGVIIDSDFDKFMNKNNYNIEEIKKYCTAIKQGSTPYLP